MIVDYESRNQVWVWDADGDGYFEGRSARIANVVDATGMTAAALGLLVYVDPADEVDPDGAVA